jgi:glycosyltransferase involved in cell wall biosynthesis
VNSSDAIGGAARAAYRLHESLLGQSIDSQMLVHSRVSNNATVLSQSSNIIKVMNKLYSILDRLPLLFYKNKTKTLFSASRYASKKIIHSINEINPDIVHLHWVCNGMIKIEDFKKINAPVVWSLHDMWAFTGGCHYDEECSLYKSSCGNCKVLRSNSEKDLSRKIFIRKKNTFEQIPNMVIVGLSKWMMSCANNSQLFKANKIINLPNPIDTNKFRPFDKTMSRELWGLAENKKLILFGAMDATSDPRKGFNELTKALSILENVDIELVVFGGYEPKDTQKSDFKTSYLGDLSDDISLVTLYNAVDVVIVPSLQENLSNSIMESLSCATPVIGFDIGGNSDMIEHKVTGYLAKPYDVEDLKNGIEFILNTCDYSGVCNNARKKVLNEFDSKSVAKRYIRVYKELLDE